MQVFQTEEGQFDYQAYLDKLSDPDMDWTDLERWGRSVLPEMKFQTYLSAQVHVSDREVRERYRRDNAEVTALYVAVPFGSEMGYEPTEAELDSLYQAVREDYREPESRRVALIAIEKKPTKEDEREVEERLLEIREEILGGRDFAEMAADYSDDAMSAQKGGDLGSFSRGEMVAEFDSVAFSLGVGEISQPVRTQFGYHLIRVEERTVENDAEKIHARHILMRVEPGYDTIDSLSTLVRDLSESIKSKGFEKAAESFGIAIQRPEPFIEGYFIEGVGFAPRVINFSFNHHANAVSSPIEEEQAVYFVKILERLEERDKSLDEIKSQLTAEIQRKRSERKALERAESIRKAALTGGNLETAALESGLETNKTPSFKISDSVPGVGGNTAFAVASHMLPIRELSPPIKGRNAYYLIRVTDRKEPDMDLFAEQRAEIMNEIRREKIMRYLSSWYDEIRQRAKVVDLREQALS